MAHKDARVKVRAPLQKGNTLNLPHTEHKGLGTNPENVQRGPQTVTFDSRGEAEVSRAVADSLLEFYPNVVEEVASVPSE